MTLILPKVIDFNCGGAALPLSMSINGNIALIDPVSYDAIHGVCPVPSPDTDLQDAWDDLVAYGGTGGPESCMCIIADITVTGYGTYELTHIYWGEDSGSGFTTPDFYGVDFGSGDGSTELSGGGSFTTIFYPVQSYTVNLVTANSYPGITTEGRKMPAWLSTRRFGITQEPVAEITINGGTQIRMVSFIKEGDFTGFLNTYHRAVRNLTGFGAGLTATAVAPNTGIGGPSNAGGWWGGFGYEWGGTVSDASPTTLSGSLSDSGAAPATSLDIAIVDTMGLVDTCPDLGIDITSTILFDPTGDIPAAHGDFTLSSTGGHVTLAVDGVNAPYTGMTVTVVLKNAGVLLGSIAAARNINPSPSSGISITYT